jgi:uncharacterized integral membrane protein
MLAGTFGFPMIVIVLGTLLPGVHSVVLAVTVNCPVIKDEDTFSRIVVLPCPLAIVAPLGTVQL